MNNSQIPKRYARALFELAGERGADTFVERDMRSVRIISANVSEFRNILRSPVIKPHLKKKIISALFEGQFHELTIRFLNLMISQGRESFLAEIAEQYIALCRVRDGIVDVDIISAQPLESATLEAIEQKIASLTGLKPNSTQKLNPRLLGGFMVRFGDSMYDASLRNKLTKITRDFQTNIYEKGF